MLKANTVEQFHILRHLQENFHVEAIQIELPDRNKVKVKPIKKPGMQPGQIN